ncbi:MAG TPA: diaminopimelate decarboxylase [Candidatus Limnocylindria bacterium]|nr:diaminopimelate decarboxylase [Candidatus Limnocylindria bacterium]
MIDRALWPLETGADARGHLRVSGVDLVGLADRLGTPLYAYDAATIRDAYRRYGAACRALRPVRISYAIKACALRGVAAILADAGADASAASLGELLAAKRAGFPMARTQLHGNAKTDDELRAALRLGVGRIVIDGADEIDRLARLVARRARPVPVWLRVSPGIGADTHPHLRTGVLDSKFGAPIAGGDALAQCRAIAATKNLRLVGIHAHLGTQLHEAERYRELGAALAALGREVRAATGIPVKEIAVGGGLAIALRSGDPVLDLEAYARAVGEPIRSEESLRTAVLYLEPGRSLVGRAGVALYRVVGTKRVAGVRTFVSVDGGMGDNIRPALYDAAYTAVLADRATAAPAEHVAIAGKYCESGDLLIRDVALPTAEPGDVLAIPAAGAYSVAMASNYNHHLRPAVALIDGGRAKLIRMRETHADIWRLER